MRELARPLLIVTLALLVPVLPFLGFGGWLEARVESWFDPPPAHWGVAALTVGVLSTDILLPVPSSLVSTFAGAQLGVLAATAASWLGMTIAAILGFWLAKMFGRSILARFSTAADIERLDRVGKRFGPTMLVVTRALPVLAEAAVLLAGTTELSWRRFLPPVMLSNLGIAAVYAVLGQVASTHDALPLALAASVALPLLATTFARWLVPASREPAPQN